MKIKKLTLKECNDTIDQINFLFKDVGKMNRCYDLIVKIKNELNEQKRNDLINVWYKSLQTIYVNEYNNGIAHRIRCSTFYKKRVNKTMKLNLFGYIKAINNRTWNNLINRRMKARDVLLTLDQILDRGTKTIKDEAISVSYLYLASIDGVFGKNLKDILIFDKLSNFEKINFSEIDRMKLNKIKECFDGINDSEYLFEGWDENIRNAIAHSSFWFDKKRKKIFFEDKVAGITKEKTVLELNDLLNKLTNIDILVFYYNQIFRLSHVISNFPNST